MAGTHFLVFLTARSLLLYNYITKSTPSSLPGDVTSIPIVTIVFKKRTMAHFYSQRSFSIDDGEMSFAY